ncbi:MAG: 3-phosphoglycerate dehydrogenase [Gammaproteobacteria bacterium]|nr:3-phosphoglycerate dehydrogenase [Gammaproteobacteria bacterium]|tara:strand:- start:1643 stop:2830 length:1188 start_codon:yes stop_codon:yes gene_type:complete
MTKYKIKTLSNISPKGLEVLSNSSCVLDENEEDPDGVLIRSTKLSPASLNLSLKAISRAGVGVNNIPLDDCTERGIVVFNTPGANANAVKELVLAALMLSSRNVFSSIDFVKNLGHLDSMEALEPFLEENKKQFKGRELSGSTLGVLGLGSIGSKVARMGVALDMKVIGYDKALSVEAAWRLPSQVEPADTIEELFKKSDFITLHIPAIDSTKGLINSHLLKHCNRTSLLNFARKEVVDDESIIGALEKNNLSNFITDFPTPTLIKRANEQGDVILLPHIGASTSQAEENCAVMATEQITDFLQNGNITNSVNFPNVNLARSTEYRLAITNKNVPAMIGQIATNLGELGLNIVDMTNVSRGDIAYNLIDVENEIQEDAVDKLSQIENVLNVRLVI